jgi:hypothetical protein
MYKNDCSWFPITKRALSVAIEINKQLDVHQGVGLVVVSVANNCAVASVCEGGELMELSEPSVFISSDIAGCGASTSIPSISGAKIDTKLSGAKVRWFGAWAKNTKSA